MYHRRPTMRCSTPSHAQWLDGTAPSAGVLNRSLAPRLANHLLVASLTYSRQLYAGSKWTIDIPDYSHREASHSLL